MLSQTASSNHTYRNGPLGQSYWQIVTNKMLGVGQSEGLHMTHLAAVSIRVADFLLFLSERNVDTRRLTEVRWYRSLNFARPGGRYSAAQWVERYPELGLSEDTAVAMVPMDALYHFEVGGEALFLATPPEQTSRVDGVEKLNPLLLGGSSQQALITLIRNYYETLSDRSPRTQFWGTCLENRDAQPVAENELILARSVKDDLLQYVDRFWRHQAFAREHRLPLNRGLLLAGHAGTGKTQFIRHLFTRLPDARRHVFAPASDQASLNLFPSMLSQIAWQGKPAIVVIEDIDRLFQLRGITPQFFLNALDGLLSLDAAILWVATTNDPRALELNLLDRPGRFDRVVVFPLPGEEERKSMLRLFCQDRLDEESVMTAVELSGGLSGAHIREACVSALLAHLDIERDLADLLYAELLRASAQHDAARRYDLDLGRIRAAAGFSAAPG